jgi:hypothetical protein
VAADIRCVELRKHPPAASKVNKGTFQRTHAPGVPVSRPIQVFVPIRHERMHSELMFVLKKTALCLARAAFLNT